MHYPMPQLVAGARNPAAVSACKDYTDAIYFSIDKFSLRARARDITLDNLDDFVKYVRDCGLKAYLAVNTVIYPDDLMEVPEIIESAKRARVDAIIAWDPAVVQQAVDHGLRVHISTQANVSNWKAAEYYRSMGASRVVLSRELSLEQIKLIRQHTDMELEVFIHGAMCQSISGRCYLSAYLLGGSGNCGDCTQPCRWPWTLHGENGALVELGGKYLLSVKDLCMIEHIPELIDTGVNAFKIEGRLRNAQYIKTVSKCYYYAIAACFNGSYTLKKAQKWKEQLSAVYNRGFSTGFYFGIPGPDGMACDVDMNASHMRRQAVGIVLNYFPKQNAAAIRLNEQSICIGDLIIIEGASTYLEQKVESLMKDNISVIETKKGQDVGLSVAGRVRKNDRIYKIEKHTGL